MKHFGIRKKLFIFHIAAVLLVILGMGVNSYYSQLKTTKEIISQYHTDVSRRFVTPISLAISGNNYANMSLPGFVHELVDIESLIYLEASGYSDEKNKYAITYHRADKKVRRSQYEADHAENIERKLDKLNKLYISGKVDKKKILYLIDRVQDELIQYRQNQDALLVIKEYIKELGVTSAGPINTRNWTLTVSLPTTNKNNGEIIFIYDISKIKNTKERMIVSGILEVTLAIGLSLPLIWLAGSAVVSPIESLTKYISNNVKDINPDDIPSLNSKDEIGALAITFKNLLTKINKYILKIEELGNTDALTGLSNRRLYETIINVLIFESMRSNQVVSYLYMDIDNFKKYNDNYGHIAGDVVLQKVASCLNNSMSRETDYCFRFGGEEFLLVVQTNTANDSVMIAERIRTKVEEMNIEHKFNADYGRITISLGVCSLLSTKKALPKTIKDIVLSAADDELYKAKKAGRNRVSSTIIN